MGSIFGVMMWLSRVRHNPEAYLGTWDILSKKALMKAIRPAKNGAIIGGLLGYELTSRDADSIAKRFRKADPRMVEIREAKLKAKYEGAIAARKKVAEVS